MSEADEKPPQSSESKHSFFALTPSRPRPLREQVARGALIIGGVLFVASGFVLCFCPEFYIAIDLCGIIAAWLGSRGQRIAGVIMLAVALVVGILGYQYERRSIERVRRAIELRRQQQPK